MQEIKYTFGYGEFTRAEYKKAMKGRKVANLDTVVRYGVKITHEEKFTVKLDAEHGYLQRVLKTSSGKTLTDLKVKDYIFASAAIKKVLDDVFNNGEPINVVFDYPHEVEGTRYFYAFDEDTYNRQVEKLKERNQDTIKSLDKRIAKLNERIETCNALTLLLDD
jgi:hypothetical protein